MKNIKIYVKEDTVYLKIGNPLYLYDNEHLSNYVINEASCNEIKKAIEELDLLEESDDIKDEHLICTIICSSDDTLNSCSITLKLSTIKENKEIIKINESITYSDERQKNLINFVNDNFDISLSEILFDLLSFFISSLFGNEINLKDIDYDINLQLTEDYLNYTDNILSYEESLEFLDETNKEKSLLHVSKLKQN